MMCFKVNIKLHQKTSTNKKVRTKQVTSSIKLESFLLIYTLIYRIKA